MNVTTCDFKSKKKTINFTLKIKYFIHTPYK